MLKNAVILFLIGILFTRCTEEVKPVDIEIGLAYYPVEIGNYWIYDVSETKVNNNEYDSTHYQVREYVDTVFTNQASEKTYKIIKSRRTSANQPWSSDSLVLINKFSAHIRRNQDNVKLVSFVFPVLEGEIWNANAFNIHGENLYRYQFQGKSFALNGLVYDTTVTVVQGERDDIILDDRQEVYAYNTGLIYKKFLFYEYLQENGSLNKTKIAKGVKRIMKLNTFYAANK